MQFTLIDSVTNILKQKGYVFIPLYNKSNCFDITAKKDNILFIKCIENVDNFKNIQINELKLISEAFQGIPLIISIKNKHKSFKDNVIYEKDSIKILTIKTFLNILNNEAIPSVYARRGGEFVQIDPNKFREALQKLKQESVQFNVKDFADDIGVTRRTVSYYQKGEMSAKKSVFDKITEKFGSEVSKPINIFDWKPDTKEGLAFNPEDNLRTALNEQLEQIGLQILWTKRSPFDGVTGEDYKRELIITGIGKKDEKKKILLQKAQIISNFSEILNTLKMFIVENEPIKEILLDEKLLATYNIPLLPVIKQDELDDIKDAKELISKIKKKDEET